MKILWQEENLHGAWSRVERATIFLSCDSQSCPQSPNQPFFREISSLLCPTMHCSLKIMEFVEVWSQIFKCLSSMLFDEENLFILDLLCAQPQPHFLRQTNVSWEFLKTKQTFKWSFMTHYGVWWFYHSSERSPISRYTWVKRSM